jgi:hypothetical protein
MSEGTFEPPVPGKPGRPRTGSARVDFAADAELRGWLESRAGRVTGMPGLGFPGASLSRQAKAELVLWRTALELSLAEVPPMTLGQCLALARVAAGPVISAAMKAADGRPVMWGAAAVAVADARAPVGKLPPHPGNFYSNMHGIDEDETLALLAGLTVVQDHALVDALSRWWERGGVETVEAFEALGLRVADGPYE